MTPNANIILNYTNVLHLYILHPKNKSYANDNRNTFKYVHKYSV